MKPRTKDIIKEERDKTKEKVKDSLGKLTGNHDLEHETKYAPLKGVAWKMFGAIKNGLVMIAQSVLLFLNILLCVGLSVGLSCRKTR